MTPDHALSQLETLANPERAEGAAAYHKAQRRYLGVPNPALNDLAQKWRQSMSLEERIALADSLWKTNIHEARIAASKLLTQARIRPDEEVWQLIASWVPEFDAWAIADHACMAGQRRIMASLPRLDEVARWTVSPHMWTRRAALVITLPLTRQNHPSVSETDARERVLCWAASYVDEREWFIQKAVAWWLRDLSKHDPERVAAFLEANGDRMKAFARKEAMKYLRPAAG